MYIAVCGQAGLLEGGGRVNKRMPFIPGDRVVTKFYRDESDIIRRVESCVQDRACGSGWRVVADAGEPCPCCGRRAGRPVCSVDSAWFEKVTGDE